MGSVARSPVLILLQITCVYRFYMIYSNAATNLTSINGFNCISIHIDWLDLAILFVHIVSCRPFKCIYLQSWSNRWFLKLSSYQTGITSINLAVILEYDTVYPLTISQTYPMHQLCVHPSNLQCVCYDVVMAFLVTYHHCDFIPCVHVFYFLHYQWIDYIQCMVFRIDKPSTIMLYQSQVL